MYRGLDIGTAKPSPSERERVPHHLIDVVDPDEAYSAGAWRAAAIEAIEGILSRGCAPLIVGGTMLYYRALAAGLDALPSRDVHIRKQIDAEAIERGWPALHADLARVDAASAARIMPNDAQRIQRALEVWRMTGRPLSSQRGAAAPSLPFQLKGFALLPTDRDQLKKGIERRFDAMLARGLLEEVEALKKRYRLSAESPSMRAVGYRQAWAFLAGAIDRTEMREQAIAATRQLAKRQMTWLRSASSEFRSLLRLDAGGGEDAPVAFQLLLDELGEALGRRGR